MNDERPTAEIVNLALVRRRRRADDATARLVARFAAARRRHLEKRARLEYRAVEVNHPDDDGDAA